MSESKIIARFPVSDREVGVVKIGDEQWVVRVTWDADGSVINSNPIDNVGEALTIALDRANLYDVVAARVAQHAADTAAFVREMRGDELIAEHRGDIDAARTAGYFRDDLDAVRGSNPRRASNAPYDSRCTDCAQGVPHSEATHDANVAEMQRTVDELDRRTHDDQVDMR